MRDEIEGRQRPAEQAVEHAAQAFPDELAVALDVSVHVGKRAAVPG